MAKDFSLRAPRGPDRREGERGRRDDLFGPRDPRHGQGEAPGGHRRGGRARAGSRTANRVPLDVAVGDKVIYSKYGGTEVKVEGDEYLILSARDVLAVVGTTASNHPGFGAGARARLSAGPRSISRRRRHHGSQAAEVR